MVVIVGLEKNSHAFPTRAASAQALAECFGGYYNPIRLQSSSGDQNPMEFERNYRLTHQR